MSQNEKRKKKEKIRTFVMQILLNEFQYTFAAPLPSSLEDRDESRRCLLLYSNR